MIEINTETSVVHSWIFHVAVIDHPLLLVFDAHLAAWTGKALEDRVVSRCGVSIETLRAHRSDRVNCSFQGIQVFATRVVCSVLNLPRFAGDFLTDLLLG